MQNLIEGQSTERDARAEAMAWIENRLTHISECVGVEIASCSWDVCGTGDGGKSYHLVLTGRGGTRAIKLFTADELDRCLTNLDLQVDLNMRLTPLVIFVGSKANSKAARKPPTRRPR